MNINLRGAYQFSGLLIVLTMAACAGGPERPDAAFAAAETTIERAEQSGARRYSAVDLDKARDKLAQARAASDRGEHAVALRLAEQAEVDAEYAAAAAETERSREAAQALRDTIRTLQDELARQQRG